MKNEELNEEIYNFISSHESKMTRDMEKRDVNVNVRFTTFGHIAGCRALFDVINSLDVDTKIDVIQTMKSISNKMYETNID